MSFSAISPAFSFFLRLVALVRIWIGRYVGRARIGDDKREDVLVRRHRRLNGSIVDEEEVLEVVVLRAKIDGCKFRRAGQRIQIRKSPRKEEISDCINIRSAVCTSVIANHTFNIFYNMKSLGLAYVIQIFHATPYNFLLVKTS